MQLLKVTEDFDITADLMPLTLLLKGGGLIHGISETCEVTHKISAHFAHESDLPSVKCGAGTPSVLGLSIWLKYGYESKASFLILSQYCKGTW